MEGEKLSKIQQAHKRQHEEYYPMHNWRAWGSWFSWGSPIGLTLGYAIVLVSTGVFIWLLALAAQTRR